MFTRRMLRIKAMQGLYAHYVQENCSKLPQAVAAVHNGFVDDIAQLQRTHLQLLQALLRWAKMDKEEEQYLLSAHRRTLHDNLWIKKLRQSQSLSKLLEEHKVEPWAKDTVQLCYYESIAKNSELQRYRQQRGKDSKKEADTIQAILEKAVFAHASVQECIEPHFCEWLVYKESFEHFSLAFVRRFAKQESAAFAPLYSVESFREDRLFYQQLVGSVLEQYDYLSKLLAQNTPNWHEDRMFLLDRTLIQMGLAEAKMHTPKAVIINEYIEMAKDYSTEKSYQFVHGLLDKLIKPTTHHQKANTLSS